MSLDAILWELLNAIVIEKLNHVCLQWHSDPFEPHRAIFKLSAYLHMQTQAIVLFRSEVTYWMGRFFIIKRK